MEQVTLSEHDIALLKKIRAIDEECGYTEWPSIASLAAKLENKEKREYWQRQCSHYNHLEEASIGEL